MYPKILRNPRGSARKPQQNQHPSSQINKVAECGGVQTWVQSGGQVIESIEPAKGVVTVGTKKAIFLVAVLFVGILSTSCAGSLTQAKAIAKVVEKHPGFPAEPGKVNRIEVPIGGRKGNTAKVDLTTAVEPWGKDSYVVTLTKNRNLTINGTPIVTTWKYKVDKGSVTLIENRDMDAAVTIIK